MDTIYKNHRLIIIIIISLPLFLSAQRISSFSPASGRIGTSVTINGTGFDAIASNNIVFFGATKAKVVSASAIQLLVTVPAGASFQPISVTKGGLTAYASKPFITTFGCAPIPQTAASFGNKLNFSTGFFSSPISIAIADFDGDGKPDIASTNQDDNSVSIFLNISNSSKIDAASFAPAVNFLTDAGPAGIVTGDIDGDGKTDIAITTSSNTIAVLRNTSTPGIINASSFIFSASLPTSNGPTDDAGTSNIAMGDLDGNGKPDLVVANSNKNTISIYPNISTPGAITSASFSARTDINAGTNPLGLVVTDIDGDGKPEIAVNNAYGFNLSVYRNTSISGSISFTGAANFITSYGTAGLAAGDLNNDGRPELVVTNLLANTISIFPNNAVSGSINSSSLGASITLSAPNNPVSPVISDCNGDGKPDIAFTSYDINAANSNNNPLSLYVNNITGATISSGSFLTRLDMITGGSLGKIAIGDLDGDGKPDFVIPNYTSDLITILKNNSSIFASLPPATINGLNAVCDDGVWKNYYDPANTSRIICSIRDNGNSLGSTNARVYVDAAPLKYNSSTFLARHYLITPSSQPATGIQVRLYFTQAEFSAMQAADSRLQNPADLGITKYQGPTEDGIFNPTDANSLIIIPPSSIDYGSAFGGFYADFTVSGLSEFWFNSGNVVLPVQLISFKAERLNNAVSLQWSTAIETNNDYFTVEKSTDGIVFTSIGILKAGNPSVQPHLYELTDFTPLNGLNYYRLKQTDKDGKTSYSIIRIVEWNGQTASRVRIAPQPMKEQATVSFIAKAGKTVLNIYNIQGIAIKSYTFINSTNSNVQLIIDKGRMASGVYFYKIFNNNQEQFQGKIIIE